MILSALFTLIANRITLLLWPRKLALDTAQNVSWISHLKLYGYGYYTSHLAAISWFLYDIQFNAVPSLGSRFTAAVCLSGQWSPDESAMHFIRLHSSRPLKIELCSLVTFTGAFNITSRRRTFQRDYRPLSRTLPFNQRVMSEY